MIKYNKFSILTSIGLTTGLVGYVYYYTYNGQDYAANLSHEITSNIYATNWENGIDTELKLNHKSLEINDKNVSKESLSTSKEKVRIGSDFLETVTLKGNRLRYAKQKLSKMLSQGDHAALQWVSEYLAISSPTIQRHLIDVLANGGTHASMEILLEFAKYADVDSGAPKMKALRAIEQANGAHDADASERRVNSEFLTRYLNEKDEEIVAAVSSAISKLGDPESIGMLLQKLEEEPKSLSIISDSLAKATHPEAIEVLSSFLKGTNDLTDTSILAVGSALGSIDTTSSVGAILQFASRTQNAEDKEKVISWLYQVNGEETISLLLDVQDKYDFVDKDLAADIHVLGEKLDNEPISPRLNHFISIDDSA